jgi:putative tricarboxylic transport membrane protein
MKFDLHNNRDALAGLLFSAIGVMAFVGAEDYPMGFTERMGPGYFPMVLGGILTLFGICIFVRGLLSGEPVQGEWGWKPLVLITLAIVLFGFLMERLGLVPALVAVFFASALGGHEFRFRETLLLTLVMGTFAVGVFFYGLKLPYPLFGW